MITESQIKSCYDAYIKATGLDIKLTTHLRYSFERFCFEGYSPEDITLVVNYIKRRIKIRRREKESLLPRNLIQNTSNFAEDLSIAKLEQRDRNNRPDSSKQEVLNSTGRTIQPKENCVSVGQVMNERLKMSDMLKKWKTENL